MTPPATGSAEFLAVTVTASGLAKAVPVRACCPVPPVTSVMANPWLWKAPISGLLGKSRGWLRWSLVICVLVPGKSATAPAWRAGLPGSNGIVGVGPP